MTHDDPLYDLTREVPLLALDLAKLRPRIRRLERNLDYPRHATEALKFLDLALQEVAEIRWGREVVKDE